MKTISQEQAERLLVALKEAEQVFANEWQHFEPCETCALIREIDPDWKVQD